MGRPDVRIHTLGGTDYCAIGVPGKNVLREESVYLSLKRVVEDYGGVVSVWFDSRRAPRGADRVIFRLSKTSNNFEGVDAQGHTVMLCAKVVRRVLRFDRTVKKFTVYVCGGLY